jgi:endonuclease/exonuclease/phosphatase family metal-dependent hydrolase
MKKSIGLLVFLLWFLCQTNAQEIKLITYNIRLNTQADGVNAWPLRKEKFGNLLNQYNANIWCFQEVLHNQLIDLKAMLPEYSYVGVGRDDGKEAGEYSPIFYKNSLYQLVSSGTFWLSPTPNIVASKGWDAAITRICSWAQLEDRTTHKVFFVFNTHFDHIGKKARKESAKLILSKMNEVANDKPIVLAGDFNSEPCSKAYKTIAKNKIIPFTDSYSKQKDNCTFTGFKVNGGICKRIDFIFFNNYFEKITYLIITDNNGTYYPSDHLPVLTLLKFK